MAEDVIRRLNRPRERQHDTALVGFGDAAGALTNVPLECIGLPEVRVAGVKDDGCRVRSSWPRSCESLACALSHSRGQLRGLRLFRVVDSSGRSSGP